MDSLSPFPETTSCDYPRISFLFKPLPWSNYLLNTGRLALKKIVFFALASKLTTGHSLINTALHFTLIYLYNPIQYIFTQRIYGKKITSPPEIFEN